VITAAVTIYGGTSVGAFNKRCTNYVLVSQNAMNAAGVEDFDCFNAIGGGEAGRTAASVQVGRVIYASWHSKAVRSNDDTWALLDECQDKGGVDAIVIGGDFNTEPDEIVAMINRHAIERGSGQNNWFCSVFNSGAHTHRGRRGDSELAFLVVYQDQYRAANVCVQKAGPSDHHPVIMDIPL
jgi:hypothetical protein